MSQKSTKMNTKKNTKKTMRIITYLAFSSLMISSLYTNCSKKFEVGQREMPSFVGPEDNNQLICSEGGDCQSYKVGATAGIMSFNGINESLLKTTGIQRNRCQNEFNEVAGTLPQKPDLNVVTKATQSAISTLATCYCDEAVFQNNDGGRANILKNVDINKNASSLSAQEREAIVSDILDAFWSPSVATNPSGTMAKGLLLETLNGVIASDANANSTAASARAAFAVCVGAASALVAYQK